MIEKNAYCVITFIYNSKKMPTDPRLPRDGGMDMFLFLNLLIILLLHTRVKTNQIVHFN